MRDVTSVRQMLTAFLQTLRGVRTPQKSAPGSSGEKRRAKSEER
jgi:hypothetical protein